MSQSKVSAEKKAELKTRVASAWTLAKTMLPSAPSAVQYKFAQTLLGNSTRALTAATKQTAINAHYTRLAEQIQQVFKKDMNDMLENSSVWQEAMNGIKSEFHKDPKSAAAKVACGADCKGCDSCKKEKEAAAKQADDRSAAGPLPAKYPDPARNEPSEMDGSHAAERPATLVNPDKGEKMAAKKTACGEGCKGCDECKDKKKEASVKTACEGGCKEGCEHKEAAAKAAKLAHAIAKSAKHDADCDCNFCEMKKEASAKSKKADDTPAEAEGEVKAGEAEQEAGKALEEAGKDEENANEGEAEAEAPAADMEAPEEGDAAGEEFDPEKTNLQEAVDTLKTDIEQIEQAIAEFDGEAGDMTDMMPEEGMDDMPDMMGQDMDMGMGQEGMMPPTEPGMEGQELNMDDIFNEGAMTDKVSALNNEDGDVLEVTFDWGGGPDDAADMEHALDQMSEQDFFSQNGVQDHFASLLGESKTAGDFDGSQSVKDIVKPGELADFFMDDAGSGKEDRDNMTDHEDDIFADILKTEKTPTRNDKRDTHSNLKDSDKKISKVVGKAAAAPRKLKPAAAAPARKEAGIDDGNLAALLFGSDEDYS